jgi:RNA polymerase sigma factor (sigma-70 family)
MTAPRPRKPLQGDEDALFGALAADLVRVISRLVHTDPATIDDACQFAWLQLLRCQPTRETVRAWLVTVARNEAIRLDRIQRRCAALSVGEREPGCHPEPAAATDAYTLAIDLDEALTVLASLPERKRDLYALKVLGFSYEEICRITGDSYSTVNRQLVRAAALIRRARAG